MIPIIAAAVLAWGPAQLPKPELDPIAAKAPAVCRERPSRFTDDGRRMLLALESQIVNDVLGNKEPRGGVLAEEVHTMLRRYPQAEMVFVLPEPVPIPASAFHTRRSATHVPYSRVGPPGFSFEISDVALLQSGRRTALALYLSYGPVGPEPSGKIWAWGLAGRFCYAENI